MKTKPKVSVLMPAYNCAAYLPIAIRSILSQTFEDFELIIIDDGSKDSTWDIANSIDDKRISLLQNPRNMGISISRNRAIRESRGKYVAWLDSDDIALPDRLEKQVRLLDSNPKIGLCHSNWAEIDSEGIILRPSWNQQPFFPTEWLMLWTNPIAQSTVMLRRTLFDSSKPVYNPECDPAEDYDLWTRLILQTRFSYIEDVLVEYRTTPSSAFHQGFRKAFLKSLEANLRLVQELAECEAPPFHQFLTTFASVLKTEREATDVALVAQWYWRLEIALAKRFSWTENTAWLIDREILERLISFIRYDRHAILIPASLQTLLPRKFTLFLHLRLIWLYRRLRHETKTFLQKCFKLKLENS